MVITDHRHHAKLKNEMAEHPVPPMLDPMGKYWEQPARAHILVDNTHAIMSRETFDGLKEYSRTKPTGAYPGKMWRRYDGSWDQRFLASGGRPTWLLCWYGHAQEGYDPKKYVSNHWRTILLSDGDISEVTK